jgi:hypothetical protein
MQSSVSLVVSEEGRLKLRDDRGLRFKCRMRGGEGGFLVSRVELYLMNGIGLDSRLWDLEHYIIDGGRVRGLVRRRGTGRE